MNASDWISLAGAGIAGYLSWKANNIAKKANNTADEANTVAEEANSLAGTANSIAENSARLALSETLKPIMDKFFSSPHVRSLIHDGGGPHPSYEMLGNVASDYAKEPRHTNGLLHDIQDAHNEVVALIGIANPAYPFFKRSLDAWEKFIELVNSSALVDDTAEINDDFAMRRGDAHHEFGQFITEYLDGMRKFRSSISSPEALNQLIAKMEDWAKLAEDRVSQARGKES